MTEKIELLEGGIIEIFPEFFGKELSDKLMEVIKNKTPWKQEINSFNKPFPRLTAWYADEGLTYSYSGVMHHGIEWTNYLTEIRNRVNKKTECSFNSLLLNYYRNGQDSVGMHSDAEYELGLNPVVASVTFGAERDFVIQHLKSKEKTTYRLSHGSLLVMGGTMQHFYFHGVPKTKEEVGERINLTFREIKRQR